MKNEKEIRFIELFGGVGGFRKGLEQANNRQETNTKYNESESGLQNIKSRTGKRKHFVCVWYNEIDKYCVQVYNKNFNEKYEPKDIRTVKVSEIPEHNLLTGGFPCQSFSIAGKRKGFKDTRGTLFYEICRILQAKKPKCLLLENVKGLLSHDKGRTFAIILSSLDELGYDVEWQVLNSRYHGVPQNRERVFIIGHLREKGVKQVFPIRTNAEKVQRVFGEKEEPMISNMDKLEVGFKSYCPTLKARDYKDPKVVKLPKIYDGQHKQLREFENTSPTLCARMGTGGNNVPMVVTGNNEETRRIKETSQVSALKSSNQHNPQSGGTTLVLGNNQYETKKRKFEVNPKEVSEYLRKWLKKKGLSKRQLSSRLNLPFTLVEHFFRKSVSISLPDDRTWLKLKEILGFDEEFDERMLTFVEHITSKHQGNRIYSSEGLSPTLNSTIEPTILMKVANCVTPDGYLMTGKRKRVDGKAVLTSAHERRLRRLTPRECERLQAFPDDWTAKGLTSKGEEITISDTQRYKMCGNAVTCSVIQAIGEQLQICF